MRDSVFIEKIERGNRAKIVAVCTSKRTAVKLILTRLLETKAIKTSEIGEVRKYINDNELTSGFPETFKITYKNHNKFFNL